jgi:hypothetical protein
MAMKQVSEGPSEPEWLRLQVPVTELVQWVQGVGLSGGLDQAAMYLLGNVLDAYGWERDAAWAWTQARWDGLTGARLEGALSWMEQVSEDLRRAIQSWESVAYWLMHQSEPGVAGAWKQWIAARTQHLVEGQGRVCQECAAWCEQAQTVMPGWLLRALGLAPGVMEAGGTPGYPGHALQGWPGQGNNGFVG